MTLSTIKALLRALRSRRLPEEYIPLISIICTKQRASVNHSSEFPVRREVKQGDTLSAMFFNCVLDIAFDKSRLSLHQKNVFIAYGLPRLTNARYAEDVLLYAKSLDELISMTEGLMDALQQIGLNLNTKKTKVQRYNPFEEESTINFTEIGGDFFKIEGDDEFHRCLGRLLSTSLSNRTNIAFKNRQ